MAGLVISLATAAAGLYYVHKEQELQRRQGEIDGDEEKQPGKTKHILKNKTGKTLSTIGIASYIVGDPNPFKVRLVSDHKFSEVIIMIGQRGTGKTNLLRAIMKAYNDEGFFKFGRAISGSEAFTTDLDFLKSREILSFNEEAVLEYLEKLRQLRKQGDIPNNFLILDDCINAIGDRNSNKVFKNFVNNSRHFRTTIIVAVQRYSGAMIDMRENATKVIVFRTNTTSNDEAVFNDFGKYLPDEYRKFPEFQKMLCDTTIDHRGLIFINNEPTHRSYAKFMADEVAPHSFKMYKHKEEDSDDQPQP